MFFGCFLGVFWGGVGDWKGEDVREGRQKNRIFFFVFPTLSPKSGAVLLLLCILKHAGGKKSVQRSGDVF